MIIRFLTPDDVPEHDKITSQAFSYSCEIGNPDSALPCEKVLGAFDDDGRTLLADFELNERKCYYDGGILTCAAVGGVAAKPEHRGKGAVTALFARLMENPGYDISILYPFSEGYYRRFGYERTGLCLSACVPFPELSAVPRTNDVTLYEGKDTEKLLSIYNRCAGELNLCFIRDSAEAYSDKPYYSQKYTYIYKDGAYATIQIDRETGSLIVSEIFFDSLGSMLGILGFFRNFEANLKKIIFSKLPLNTPLTGIIREMKDCEIKMHNNGSAAILNTEKVLGMHKYPVSEGGFTLQAGEDIFGVTVSGGKTEVIKDASLLPDVITGKCTAAGILLNGTSIARYNPALKINNPESDFFKMFPQKVSFFCDEF